MTQKVAKHTNPCIKLRIIAYYARESMYKNLPAEDKILLQECSMVLGWLRDENH